MTKAEIQAQNSGSNSGPVQTFDETKVKAKLQLIEDNVNKVIGKKGHNPYFWITNDVQPLVDRFLKGERTPELEKAILSLPDNPPALNITLGMTEDEQRRKYAEILRQKQNEATGISFFSKN